MGTKSSRHITLRPEPPAEPSGNCEKEYWKYFDGKYDDTVRAWNNENCTGNIYSSEGSDMYDLDNKTGGEWDSLVYPPHWEPLVIFDKPYMGYNGQILEDHFVYNLNANGEKLHCHTSLWNNYCDKNYGKMVGTNNTGSYTTMETKKKEDGTIISYPKKWKLQHVRDSDHYYNIKGNNFSYNDSSKKSSKDLEDLKMKCCTGEITGSRCGPLNSDEFNIINRCAPIMQKNCSIDDIMDQYTEMELLAPGAYIPGDNLSGYTPLRGVNKEECLEKCQEVKNCKGATYEDNYKGSPACWLKSKITGDPINASGTNTYKKSEPKVGRCHNACKQYPIACDAIKGKFCKKNPKHRLCKCWYPEHNEEWKERQKNMLPVQRGYPKGCVVKACTQKVDLHDTLVDAHSLEVAKTCPPIVSVDQSITVNGDNNVLSNIRQNVDLDIHLPPPQIYTPKGDYQAPEVPIPDKIIDKYDPKDAKKNVPIGGKPSKPSIGEAPTLAKPNIEEKEFQYPDADSIPKVTVGAPPSSNPYEVMGIDFSNPIILFIIVILIVVVLSLIFIVPMFLGGSSAIPSPQL